jgi:hypothetical protein
MVLNPPDSTDLRDSHRRKQKSAAPTRRDSPPSFLTYVWVVLEPFESGARIGLTTAGEATDKQDSALTMSRILNQRDSAPPMWSGR